MQKGAPHLKYGIAASKKQYKFAPPTDCDTYRARKTECKRANLSKS
jgi:hypothetical protein